MPESLVVKAMRAYKAGLERLDQDALWQLSGAWYDSLTRMEPQMRALADEVRELKEEGKTPTTSRLFQLDRMQRLRAQIDEEARNFAEAATGEVEALQSRSARWGRDQAIASVLNEHYDAFDAGASDEGWERIGEELRFARNGRSATIDSSGAITLWEIDEDGQYYWAGSWEAESLDEALRMGNAHVGRALGGVITDFTRLPREATQFMVGGTGSGTPLRLLLEQRVVQAGVPGEPEAQLSKLIDTLRMGTIQGKNPRTVAREMQNALNGRLENALTVARTEGLRPYRESARAAYQESGVVRMHRRVAARGPRTCAACLSADGQEFPVTETLYDHPNGRCVVGDTMVSGPRIERFYARHYDGDVIIVRTASMKELTVTPNHPILTDRGWVPANLIHEGDNVVSSPIRDWTSLGVRPEVYQIPAVIKDIPGSLGMNRFVSVPISPEDFHGDGRGSQVYIVGTNRFLWNSLKPAIRQQLSKVTFLIRNTRLVALSSLGNLTAMLQRLFRSPHDLLGNSDATMMLFNRRLLCQQAIGSSLTATLDASRFQSALDRGPGHTVSLGKAVFALTIPIALHNLIHGQVNHRSRQFSGFDGRSLSLGSEKASPLEFIRQSALRSMKLSGGILDAVTDNIVFDSVLEVSRRAFSGHVYNLQTVGDWYLADGIIVHNCTSIPVVRNLPNVEWERGPDWFEKQPEKLQRQTLGNARFEAWKSGEFEFDALATHTHDDVWGGSLNVTPLKDLVEG